jgi:hypothetical protein
MAAKRWISSELVSSLTKYFLPVFFSGVVSIFVYAAWTGALHTKSGGVVSRDVLYFVVPWALIALGIIFTLAWKVKFVVLEGSELVISSIRKTIRVPATAFESLDYWLISGSNLFVMSLKGDFGLGRKIVFLSPTFVGISAMDQREAYLGETRALLQKLSTSAGT